MDFILHKTAHVNIYAPTQQTQADIYVAYTKSYSLLVNVFALLSWRVIYILVKDVRSPRTLEDRHCYVEKGKTMKFLTETKRRGRKGPDIEAKTREDAERVAKEMDVEIVGTKQ